MRPHIVLVIDQSGSMTNPLDSWIATFNEFVDSIRYFSNTPLISVVRFNSAVSVTASGVPADLLSRFSTSNFHPMGGTALFRGVEEAIDRALKAHKDVPTQFILITDGGFGDMPTDRLNRLLKQAAKLKWRVAAIGPSASELQEIKKELSPMECETMLFDQSEAGIKALGKKGAKALEQYMRFASRGEKAPPFWK